MGRVQTFRRVFCLGRPQRHSRCWHTSQQLLSWIAKCGIFCLCSSVLLRGDNIRAMELANLFCVSFDDESPAELEKPKALVASLLRTKTNSENMTDYSACLRHMDVRCCARGWIKLFFFARWHPFFDGEKFPKPRKTIMKSWSRNKELKWAILSIVKEYPRSSKYSSYQKVIIDRF